MKCETYIFIYREYTSGVSGLKDESSQVDRFSRMKDHWKDMIAKTKDTTVIGDINVDERRLFEVGYQTKIVELLQYFKYGVGIRQVIEEDTRHQVVNGIVRSSLIDHCYCTRPDLIISKSVSSITDSDHSAIWVRKSSQTPKHYPKQVFRRVFKNFNVVG